MSYSGSFSVTGSSGNWGSGGSVWDDYFGSGQGTGYNGGTSRRSSYGTTEFSLTAPAASGVAAPDTGRVSPGAKLRLVDRWGGYTIGAKAEGLDSTDKTAAQLLADLDRYLAATHQTHAKVASGYRTPSLGLPDGTAVSFASDDALRAYLQRSAAPLASTERVDALYRSVLGRGAGAGEVTAAQDALAADGSVQGGSLDEVRRGLASSPEAGGAVAGLYRAVLGREASAAEVAGFRNTLVQGGTLADVRSVLAHSAEARSDVAEVYRRGLGREADAGGLASAEAALAGGGTLEQVRAAAARSPEAAARVSGVFEAVLGRTPEGTGWMQDVLARGGTVSEVRAGLAYSDEASGAIRGAYLQTLGRDADAAGVSYWRERLAGGLSLSEVRAALASSPEAASRASAPSVEAPTPVAPGGAGEVAPAPGSASGAAPDSGGGSAPAGSVPEAAPASDGATGADAGAQTPPGAAVAGTLGAAALDGVIRIAPSAGEGGLLASLGAGLGRAFRVVGWGAVAAVVLTPGSANPADRSGTGSGGGGPLGYRAGETRVDLTWAPEGSRLSYGAGGVLRAEDGAAGGVSLTYDRTDGTLRTAGGQAVGRLDDTGLSVDEAWLSAAKAGDIERLVPPALPDMQDPGYTPGTSPPPAAGTSTTPDSAAPGEGGFTPAPVLPDVEQGPSADGPQGPQIVESQGDPGSTRPTGPVDGVPTGPRSTTAEGASPKDKAQVDSENQVADTLAAGSYRVVQNPTQGANPPLTPERMRAEGLDDLKDPDLLIEDRVFDTYTPVEDDAGSVRNGIARKIEAKQTQRVVVDLRNTTQTEASVRAALRDEPVPGLKEIIILTETGLGRPFRP